MEWSFIPILLRKDFCAESNEPAELLTPGRQMSGLQEAEKLKNENYIPWYSHSVCLTALNRFFQTYML